MVLEAAEWNCRKLMEQHGLLVKGWKFEWSNKKRSYGTCNYGLRTISLSTYLTIACTKEQVINTILHEIAHALVGSGHNHDDVWRRKAIEIGCDGQRCGSLEEEQRVKLKSKYLLKCEKCNHSIPRHKNMGTTYTHRYCGGTMRFISN